MAQFHSYAYFALFGDDVDPSLISAALGLQPTDSWKKGDPGKYTALRQDSCWRLSSQTREPINIDALVNEVIEQLSDRVERIKQVKEELNLTSVLEIVLYVDVNEESSTPALGHDSRTIAFLHETGTTTDVDIYLFDSSTDRG